MIRSRILSQAAFFFLTILFLGPASVVWAETVDITARTITSFQPGKPDQQRFGQLTFRGGLVLSSDNKNFGGWSGLEILEGGGALLAISDTGSWLHATIERNKTGEPVGLKGERMTPLSSGHGPVQKTPKIFLDAEGFTRKEDQLWVSFESISEISHYELDLKTLVMEPQVLDLPSDLDRIKNNNGLEALVMVPSPHPFAGLLLAINEHDKTGSPISSGWVLNAMGGIKAKAKFSVKRRDDFSITDADFLNNGDLILLERHFSVARGVAMRMRRVPGTDIVDGALLDGEILIDADTSHSIDNMEGLSIYENEGGQTIFAIIADDNHSILQRTLYLEFVLNGS